MGEMLPSGVLPAPRPRHDLEWICPIAGTHRHILTRRKSHERSSAFAFSPSEPWASKLRPMGQIQRPNAILLGVTQQWQSCPRASCLPAAPHQKWGRQELSEALHGRRADQREAAGRSGFATTVPCLANSMGAPWVVLGRPWF